MDLITHFQNLNIIASPDYPRNDIGVAHLFFDLYSESIRYVIEAKTWFMFNGKRWDKDEGGFRVMELCKVFTQAYAKYAEAFDDGSEESKVFTKYATGLTGRKRRERILSDARSIQPMSLSDFDRNKTLFNCQNGTFNLAKMVLQPHSPADYITNQAEVDYAPGVVCERWERFISEVMCEDNDTSTDKESVEV
jgi:putative DNA primase/helicase